MKKDTLRKPLILFFLMVYLLTSYSLTVSGEVENTKYEKSGVFSYDQEYVFSEQNARFTGDINIEYNELSKQNILNVSSDGEIIFDVQLPNEDDYQLAIEYFVPDESLNDIRISININNAGYQTYEFPKVYVDELDKDRKIKVDNRGNHIKPKQVLADMFIISPVRLPNYSAGEYYTVSLNKGLNQIALKFEKQKLLIKSIHIYKFQSKPYDGKKPNDANIENVIIEAEYPLCKSSPMLYPISDRTSVATTPYHYSKIMLNTIGGNNWKMPGQWITWDFYIDKSGYYKITIRIRQNTLRGMQSQRRIYLDGKVPCEEFENYRFNYDRGWQIVDLGANNQPFYFYLEKGTHTITMECLLGDMLKVYQDLEKSVYELNQIYLQIIKITGIFPDIYRSYNLDRQIPNLKIKLKSLSDKLKKMAIELEKQTGSVGTELSFLHEMALFLDSLIDNPDKIPNDLVKFKSNISTLSALLPIISSQPLEIDKIQISGCNAKPMKNEGFFERLIDGFKCFFASFFTDYSVIGSDGKSNRTLNVWMSSGRDQAQILKSMIDDTFTPQEDIDVKLSLIQNGLVEATMAGKGPDIALGVSGAVLGVSANALGMARSVPIDLGGRGVLVDFKEYKDFEKLKQRFQESSFNGYTYQNKVYAIPETQDFNVMFVRTDILEKIDLETPKTWDELTNMIPALSQNNMQVGVPQSVLAMRLLQNGMSYYKDGGKRVVFSTDRAYQVYKDYMELYLDYEQPYYFDAGNRFKTGEMPIIITGFTFFNTISVLAPEIRDLWEMHLVPGTVMPDGSINHTTDGAGIACIMFKSCPDKQSGFKFIDWWTSAETQLRYGRELENTLGKAGRYATANVEAFSKLNWTTEQREVLTEQRKWLRELEEIPGSYIVSRNLSNIFIDVISNGANIRESLARYSKVMDEELERKRLEIELLN